MQDAITHESIIDASVATVWDVVTQPEHIKRWFGATAELELHPGGKGTLTWEGFGSAPLEIVKVEKPRLFSFLWVAPDEETAASHQQTLVEFALQESDGKTQIRITESGFAKLQISDNDKASLIGKHTPGWTDFGDKIQQCAESV